MFGYNTCFLLCIQYSSSRHQMKMMSIIDKINFNCFCAGRPKTKGKNTIDVPTVSKKAGSFDIQENAAMDADAFKKNYKTSKKIIELGANHQLQILPVMRGKEITDLYPPTDQVHLWNTFVVGKKLNYIVANVNDLNIGVNDPKYLLNSKADNLMDDDIKRFFDHIWEETLSGVDLQFFMIKSGRTFFVNTYCLQNGNQQTIGGLCFIRNIETLPYFQLAEDTDIDVSASKKSINKQIEETKYVST